MSSRSLRDSNLRRFEASPGDVIFIPPRTYHEMVRVQKNDLTIVGPEQAILDAVGFENGIHVGAEIFGQGPGGVPTCPAIAVRNFTLIGMTIQNANKNGVFLSGVDSYVIAKGRYVNNGDYGTYPSCSNNGQTLFNSVQGGEDTCIYIGNDVQSVIVGNRASGCTVGIQIVNSSEVVVRGNELTGNSKGVLAIVDPFNPLTETSEIRVDSNIIRENNRPNTSSDPDLTRIPAGIGILNVGSDNVVITKNLVENNNTLGVAITENPLALRDPRGIDPNPDDNKTRLNVFRNNGTSPSTGLPGADIFYDGSGRGNCFAGNTFVSSIPPNIEATFPCNSPTTGGR